MKYSLIFIAWLVCSCLFAQTEEVLTNQTVIQLYQLNLGETVVINKIKTSKTNFDVGLAGLTELKKQGLSEGVINAMVEYSGKNQAAKSQDPNDPLSDHSAGIYYLDAPKKTLLQLLPTLSNDSKTNNAAMLFSYGLAKAKTKKCVPGISAKNKIGEHKPTFYFYIPETDQGSFTFNSSFSATSPNDFVLIQFDVNTKQNQREIVVGSYNAYSSQNGVDNAKTIAFHFDKKAKGIYEVTLDANIAPGEYSFMYANNGVNRVFDFSIQ